MGPLGQAFAQDLTQSPWHIVADDIDPNNYYGVTVANGMVGLVSSPNPPKVNEVILNGVYDYYQRGRVSNILQTFSHMDLIINDRGIDRSQISGYAQTDMKQAKLITTLNVRDEASVKHELMSLRNLPFTAMSVVEITAKKDIEIVPINQITTPNHLADVRNLYSEIDRPHVLLPLMS